MLQDFKKLARSSVLLSNLDPSEADEIMSNARISEQDRGQTIFLQGEQATAVFIVLDGWVKLYRVAPSGAEAIVGVFTKGRSFGEAVAFRGSIYPVSAEAVTNCTLMRIEAEDYLRHIRANPEAAISVLSATFVHLHSLVEQVEGLKARTGAQRLAAFLCELCDSDSESGPCEVVLPYDKALIAGRLGMKPESLSRAFVRLKAEGVEIRQNLASITDIARLQRYAGDDPAAG